MHRNALVPVLRCQHVQCRTVATAAKLKTSNNNYGYSEEYSAPPKWSPLKSTNTSASKWNRPNNSGTSSQFRTSERSSQRSPPPHLASPAPKWTPSKFPSKPNRPNGSNISRANQGSRTSSQVPTSPAKAPTRKTLLDAEEPSEISSPIVNDILLEEDDVSFGKGKSKPSRSRTDPYKTRGSVVQKLHEFEKRYAQQNPSKQDNARRERTHKPKLQPKPKMDAYIPSTVTVGNLARILNVKFDRLIRKMVEAGMAEEATHNHVLTSEYAVLLAEELGRNPIIDDEAAFDLYPPPPHPDSSSLPSRPPIVTIMGHVDHGKTTLLDTLRSSSVAKGEAGGITQHIGAFSVPVNSSQGQQSITFLDTPGHAAFAAMRARGASITDIVVLVVAADDGIMPQTKEVIDLLKKDAGKVALVVAINKVDKPEANVEAVKLALLAEGIQLESFGGDVPSVEVSGLTGQGLPELVETLSAMAEVQDLRAEKEGAVHGYILESKVTKGLGPVATVLVLRGCLKAGSHILSGTHQAKIRAMTDSFGKPVKSAYPGMAVTVCGWKSLPKAGDDVLDGKESDVKKALNNRMRQVDLAASLADVDAINATRKEDRERRKLESTEGETAVSSSESSGPKELKLIIKADVSGSAEAVAGALQGIGNKVAVAKVISSAVGDVTESDVLMAKAVNAAIVAFSVSAPRSVQTLAAQNGVPIITSPIIYRLMEEVQKRVIALLPTIVETKVTGEASVLQLFDIHLKAKQVKKIAGCRVVNGMVEKSKCARIVRNGIVIHEGSLDTMRVLKKDVTEVRKGSECGISFVDFADLREGDLIQMYQTIEKPGVL